jgi:hypothetical protein
MPGQVRRQQPRQLNQSFILWQKVKSVNLSVNKVYSTFLFVSSQVCLIPV